MPRENLILKPLFTVYHPFRYLEVLLTLNVELKGPD